MTESTHVRRAAIYARVSSEEQAVEGNSLPDQVDRMTKEVASRGWQHAATFVESGFTGTKQNRPKWDLLMTAAREGAFDTVVVTKWSRFARNARVGLDLAHALEAIGVDLVVMEADFDSTTSTGRLMRHLMVGLSEFDRDMIIENMANGARRAASDRGVWPCSRTPYGYRHKGKGSEAVLIIDPEQARIVRAAADWLIEEGITTGDVCKRLNALGWLPPQGGSWTHQNLRGKLTSLSLTGEHLWGRRPDQRRADRSRHTPGRFGPPVVVRTEAILTPERFEALQSALARKATGRRAENRVYPLSARLICPCGRGYGGVYRSDRDLRQYRCQGARWRADSSDVCTAPRIDADWLEGVVWAEVTALLGDPARLKHCAEQYLKLGTTSVPPEGSAAENLSAVEDRITRLRRGVDRALEEALLADDSTSVMRVKAKLEADLRDAEQTRYALLGLDQEQQRRRASSDSLVDLISRGHRRLAGMNQEDRSEVLRLLDVRVEVLASLPSGPRRGGANGGRGPWTPEMRMTGTVPAAVLVVDTQDSGDHGAAMALPAAPRRR